MKKAITLLVVLSLIFGIQYCIKKSDKYISISSDELNDKIHGGLLGQLLGNLNGIKHENEYIEKPGNVKIYTPGLPDGAWSDDDTDIEWVYAVGMQKYDNIFLSPKQITELWRKHINTKIWCSNRYARGLMDLNIKPPLTGRIAINPWAVFNISGQFICESFGLIAPAMPQTASRIALNYTHVTIDGEPAQTTQLFTTIISTAFIEDDIEKIIEAGLCAVDQKSEIRKIVTNVISLWKENPQDWRKTREKIKQMYTNHGGRTRDVNGYELNTASTIASLLYGGGNFSETLRLAFNFGWDADNNAATCGTVIGVLKGRKWMENQGWRINDVYRNVSRDEMPNDETITNFGERLVSLAYKIILLNGGKEIESNGNKFFLIRNEKPQNMEQLPITLDRLDTLLKEVVPAIEKDIKGSNIDKARAAYLAICLEQAERIRTEYPEEWAESIKELSRFTQVINNIKRSRSPSGKRIKTLAASAGLIQED